MTNVRQDVNRSDLVITGQSGDPVTSSLVLAEGAGRDHATVIRLIRENLEDLEDFGRVGFEIQPLETAGGTQNREVAILNEQQATLLLTYMRNNEKVRIFKKALVRAFYDMREALKARPAVTLSGPQLMAAALIEADTVMKTQAAQIEEMKPKVQAFERIAFADGSFCITDAAKQLQVRPKELFSWLQANGWIYRRVGTKSYVGYQAKLLQGQLEHKITTVTTPSGEERVSTQVRVTAKGLQRLSELMHSEPLQ